MVAKIVKASYPGHSIVRPSAWTHPFVFASPHSGRDYPARFLSDTILDLADLRRSEDAYVDLLIDFAAELGVPSLLARFPRAFVDVNRHPREIDSSMFTGLTLPGEEIRSNRVLAGFGAIPRLGAEGRPIYAKRLSAQEGRARIDRCHLPYHEALSALVAECLDRFGQATVIDWHSMPATAGGPGSKLPDVIFGDRFGAACDRASVVAWEVAVRNEGLTTGRNVPYAGGHVTAAFGQPAAGVEALQIELNRSLYLDEAKVARASGFDALRARLHRAVIAVFNRSSSAVQRFAAE